MGDGQRENTYILHNLDNMHRKYQHFHKIVTYPRCCSWVCINTTEVVEADHD